MINPQGEDSVPAISLADLFARDQIDRCQFLKIDCEGAEYEILYATPPDIFQRIDKIAMEYHTDRGADANATEAQAGRLVEFLRQQGFTIDLARQFPGHPAGHIRAHRDAEP